MFRIGIYSITKVASIAETIRRHGSIENQQHWILDVQFPEDAHRGRKDHSAANLGLIRRTALNLLQQALANRQKPGQSQQIRLQNELSCLMLLKARSERFVASLVRG